MKVSESMHKVSYNVAPQTVKTKKVYTTAEFIILPACK
jgi:hypothetical protein